jgi:hypothetical protein
MAMFGKSGDSKRQDEEAARKKNDAPETAPKTPEESVENLQAQVQGSVDRAKEVGASETRILFLEKQLEKLTGVLEGLQSQVNKNASGKLPDGRRPEDLLPKRAECPTCHQYAVVCGGKHRMARVLPQAAENMQGFPGVNWNGVNYFGMVMVPEASYHAIMTTVSAFELEKRNSRFNLGKIRGWEKELRLAEAASAASTFGTAPIT